MHRPADQCCGLQEAYDAYKQHFEASPAAVLRDCIDIVPAGEPISIDEVEPASGIMQRFCTGGMSLGAISRETHETIAVAMNRIGGAKQTSAYSSAHAHGTGHSPMAKKAIDVLLTNHICLQFWFNQPDAELMVSGIDGE